MRKIFLSINLVVFVTTICLAQSTIQGRIIENGTHDELMAKPKRYAELFTYQAEKYVRSCRAYSYN